MFCTYISFSLSFLISAGDVNLAAELAKRSAGDYPNGRRGKRKRGNTGWIEPPLNRSSGFCLLWLASSGLSKKFPSSGEIDEKAYVLPSESRMQLSFGAKDIPGKKEL